MFFVFFFPAGKIFVFHVSTFYFAMFPLGVAFGFHNHHKDSMAFDANHGGVSPLAAWMEVLLRQVEQWKKGPWLFAVNKGMKHYPVMWELFHKPWNKDPY